MDNLKLSYIGILNRVMNNFILVVVWNIVKFCKYNYMIYRECGVLQFVYFFFYQLYMLKLILYGVYMFSKFGVRVRFIDYV